MMPSRSVTLGVWLTNHDAVGRRNTMATGLRVTYYAILTQRTGKQGGLFREIYCQAPRIWRLEYVDGNGDWEPDHDLVDYVNYEFSAFGKPGAEKITERVAHAWYRETFRQPMPPPDLSNHVSTNRPVDSDGR